VRPLFASANREAARLAATLARLAPTDLSVVLEGETGTGKTYIARRMHRRSRAGRPLVVVDCGALPESLLAAELFGHAAGAFTDAARARRGWLERAGDGTLLLERISSLTIEAQVVLLRALEERRFVPVGAVGARLFRARVVATTTEPLRDLIDAGAFRPDLYHRLAGFHAHLPPLRERAEDVLPSARAFLRSHSGSKAPAMALDEESARMLGAYPWPGNFRELFTTLERGCLAAEGGRVRLEDLGLPAGSWPQVEELAARRRRPLHEVTHLYALWILAEEGGNVTRAAEVLGISRRTLIRWRLGVQ
jgi:DNA-binding NtrC family response regulator